MRLLSARGALCGGIAAFVIASIFLGGQLFWQRHDSSLASSLHDTRSQTDKSGQATGGDRSGDINKLFRLDLNEQDGLNHHSHSKVSSRSRSSRNSKPSNQGNSDARDVVSLGVTKRIGDNDDKQTSLSNNISNCTNISSPSNAAQRHAKERFGADTPANPSRVARSATDLESVQFAVFILTSSKALHFRALTRSLTRSDLPRQTVIVISHDSDDEAMMQVVDELRQEFPRIHQLFHPHSCAKATPGSGRFPRYSQQGDGAKKRELPYWKYTCAKHHWFWAQLSTWAMLPSLEWMLYLEEDFLVAKHIFAAFSSLAEHADSAGYMGVMTQCRSNLWTVSGGLRRDAWHAILRHSDWFCKQNDYNWDLTIKQLFIQHAETSSLHYACAQADFAFHTGVFGKGLTHGTHMSLTDIEKKIRDEEASFFRKTDNLTVTAIHKEALHTKHAGLGGFSGENTQHCLDVAAEFKEFWRPYRVVV